MDPLAPPRAKGRMVIALRSHLHLVTIVLPFDDFNLQLGVLLSKLIALLDEVIALLDEGIALVGKFKVKFVELVQSKSRFLHGVSQLIY